MTQRLSLATTQKHALNHRLLHAVSILKMSNAELQDHLIRAEQLNPFIEVHRTYESASGSVDRNAFIALQPAEETSLYARLSEQIALQFKGQKLEIANAFLSELEPTGWIATDVRQIAEKLNCSASLCSEVLEVLQTLEPTGVFARNLKECLALQAAEKGLLDPQMGTIIKGLDLLMTSSLPAMARHIGLSVEEVAKRLALLRGFNPKPGAIDTGNSPSQPMCEVTVTIQSGKLSVELRNDVSPTLSVLVDTPPQEADLKALYNEAKELKSAIELRKLTLKSVVLAIFKRQPQVLSEGLSALSPMVRRDIAEDIGVSEATVCRAVSGLLIQCAHGCLRAEDLFCTALPKQEPTQTRYRLLFRIKAMISQENPRHPMSDNALSRLLESEGIGVSRRTVSKYRQSLGISAQSVRRMQYHIQSLTKEAASHGQTYPLNDPCSK